jgi:hypothetical protein
MVAVRSSSVSSKGSRVDPKFVDLVQVLGEMWKIGEKERQFE